MILAGACLAAVCIAPEASAATLNATVVGQPKPAAHGRVIVPVLLSAASARAAGGPTAKISLPAKRGIRTKQKVLRSGDLRIGDRVHASVGAITRHARVAVLRVTTRGSAPTFRHLSQNRTTATSSVEQAITATDKLKANPMTLLDPNNQAKSTAALRDQLYTVRYGLNVLIADLRTDADGIDAAVATIERDRPAAGSRQAAVITAEKPLLDSLSTTAATTRTTASQLDDAVTRLDQVILDVGGAGSPSIGLNEVGTVSDILHSVLDALRGP